MLKIRMQRVGRINMPAYRLVVTEHARGPKAGKFVEKVGSYNPKTKERTLNADRIKYWISVGAQASDTVHNMLITAGIQSGKKINVLPQFKAPAKTEGEDVAVEPTNATDVSSAEAESAQEEVEPIAAEAETKEEESQKAEPTAPAA